MARFGRGKTHAPIIQHGRVPPVPPVVYTDTCSGTIALSGSSVDYPSYSAMILATSGLVSYWRCGEASGAFLDSKDSNPGTANGGVTRQVAGLLTSDADKAAQSDGVTGTYVNVPSSANMNVGAQLTLECWAKPAGLHASGQPYLVGRMGSTFDWYIRHTSAASNPRWDFNVVDTAAVGTSITVTSPQPQVGVTHHLVMTYDAAGTMRAYINGVSLGTPTRTPNANVRNNAEAVRLFARTATDTTTVFNGSIDEVAFYNVVLTPQQVLDHYNAGAPPVPVTNSDAPSGTISLTGTTTESKSVADSRSGSLALTGTNTDNKVYTDGRPGTIALSGTRVEQRVYTDARAGTISLTGTRTESYSRGYSDSRSGTIPLDGWVDNEAWGFPISTLHDAFNTFDTSVWDYQPDFSQSYPSIDNGRFRCRSWREVIDLGGGASQTVTHSQGTITLASYLLDAPLVIEVDGTDPNCLPTASVEVWRSFPDFSAWVGAYFSVFNDAGVRTIDFGIEHSDGSSTNANEVYDPAEHRWWKIWLDGTTLRLLTSPDGLVWTEQNSAHYSDGDVLLPLTLRSTSLYTGIPAPYPDSSAYFDNLNLPPAVYSDSPSGTIRLLGSAADQRSYSDSRAGSLALSGTRIEAKVGADSRTGSLALAGTRLDSKTVADARSGTINLAGSAVDSYIRLITYTDSRSGTIALSGTCVSTHVKFYTDNTAGTLTLLGTRSEASVRSDSPTGLLKLLGTRAESLSRAASPTGVLRLTGTASDASTRTSTATGLIRLSGTVIESASIANNFSDNPIGTLALAGTSTATYIRIYSDSPTGRLALTGSCIVVQSYSDSRTGTLTLTGTCTSVHVKPYNDSPTGRLALSGVVADTSQRNVAPVGALKLSGSVSAAGRVNTDTCAGVLALAGVVSQTIAYVDQRTGRLILSGTVVDDHFIVATDVASGTLRLSGKVSEFWVAQGRIDYSDYPSDTLLLNGRLILPDGRPDDGIGRARVGAFETGRVVRNLTGRVGATETGRVAGNLTGSLTR